MERHLQNPDCYNKSFFLHFVTVCDCASPLFPGTMERVESVIRLAEDVLSKLGPGLSETIYQHALSSALRNACHRVENERIISVRYEGLYCGFIRADIIVDHVLCLELKAKSGLTVLDKTQAKTYLTHCDTIQQCLLINFGNQLATSLFEGSILETPSMHSLQSGVGLGRQDILHAADRPDRILENKGDVLPKVELHKPAQGSGLCEE